MNFKTLFEPKTMAVVGISLTNDSHPANVIYYKNYLRYPVKTFGVNPRGGVHKDERVFARIGDIPEHIDLAVIAVRAEYVLGVIEECIAAGVGGAVVGILGRLAGLGSGHRTQCYVEAGPRGDEKFCRSCTR